MLEEPVFINLNQTLKIKGKKTDEEYFEVQLVQDDFIACVSQKRSEGTTREEEDWPSKASVTKLNVKCRWSLDPDVGHYLFSVSLMFVGSRQLTFDN